MLRRLQAIRRFREDGVNDGQARRYEDALAEAQIDVLERIPKASAAAAKLALSEAYAWLTRQDQAHGRASTT